MAMLSVFEARSKVLAATPQMPTEWVSLKDGLGRVLAEDLVANRNQPPFAASAMDGYAVRAADVATVPTTLEIIGEAPAGRAFSGAIGPGQALRIFTGAPLPAGADTVVIQENCQRDGNLVTVNQGAEQGAFIRPAGLDFSAGQTVLTNHTILNPGNLALAAALNMPKIPDRCSRSASRQEPLLIQSSYGVQHETLNCESPTR